MTIHALQFAFITLVACLVYHALREDDLRRATAAAFKRFGSFLVIALVAGVALQWITRWL